MKTVALKGFGVSMLALAMVACGGGGNDDPTPTPTPTMTITSTAFVEGAKIPKEYACANLGGMERSMPLSWDKVPANTSKFAVIVDDETAPCGTGDKACTHWSVYNIPNTITLFTTGQKVTDISGVVEGKIKTGLGDVSRYVGICPPTSDDVTFLATQGIDAKTKHIYKMTAYALKDTMPNINAGEGALTRSQFKATYGSHILGEATLSGTFDSTAP